MTALIQCLDESVERPQQELHLALGVREEDFGHWRDRSRGQQQLAENWFRFGQLRAGELFDAVGGAAKESSPSGPGARTACGR